MVVAILPISFNAPVPSGCTFTKALSNDTASILMRTTWASCSSSNGRSSTLLLDQRFIRV